MNESRAPRHSHVLGETELPIFISRQWFEERYKPTPWPHQCRSLAYLGYQIVFEHVVHIYKVSFCPVTLII